MIISLTVIHGKHDNCAFDKLRFYEGDRIVYFWDGINGDLNNTYIGQKDQDGDYAEKCHIFFNFEVWMHQPKTVLIKSKNM